MTIFGAIATRDAAVVWADTLLTNGGWPRAHASKLAINALAGVIGVGCGWKSLGDEADRAVLGGPTIEGIKPAVAQALRTASARVVPHRREPHRYAFAGNIYLTVGFEFDRVCVTEFQACEFFEPHLGVRCLWPGVPLPANLAEQPSPDTIARIAGLQAAELERGGGHVGRLSIVTLTAHGICIMPPRDLILPPENPGCGGTDRPRPFSGDYDLRLKHVENSNEHLFQVV